ncbi:Putative amidase domain-containing protein [Gracilibacillus ureilyticus]|uniref:Putative amidase domain-containing protein n=1 Tax=Gracilibacillus ureilyticus TaxID=531814 RepID=A0A1H9PJ84_9BACI|nr:amidase domain-containing protein [Gracilibacillus ureilyticus]SER48301.1 Putative amidase domain-containing protein [Gracilibacillus ureilyticus]
MNEIVILEKHWKEKFKNEWTNPLKGKIKVHNKHRKKIKWTEVKGIKQSEIRNENKYEIFYSLSVKCMIKDAHSYYHEEESQERCATFIDGKLIQDELLPREEKENHHEENSEYSDQQAVSEEVNMRLYYDRRAAVQYAERWWNDANPNYRYFEVNDCTNYISQCLRAGGIPMTGAPDRSIGWWYSGNSWSYSWSVAHSFRWYLSSSGNIFQAKLVDKPEELLFGDVICYDFQGDGRWDHNTIVVAKDSENMPLVNAHTNNSRHRYWTYEDSAAWTPDCQYKFFRIGG